LIARWRPYQLGIGPGFPALDRDHHPFSLLRTEVLHIYRIAFNDLGEVPGIAPEITAN
jgi:hypothetical protein